MCLHDIAVLRAMLAERRREAEARRRRRIGGVVRPAGAAQPTER